MSTLFPADRWVATKLRRLAIDTPVQVADSIQQEPSVALANFREEYTLSARIEVRFIANPAEYDQALRAAKRSLTAIFYIDTLARVDLAAHTLYKGEVGQALALINELRAALVE